MFNKISAKDTAQMEGVAEGILYKMQVEGKTLQEATGISEGFLENIYCLAYAHYDQGKYKEALSLFQFLSGVGPYTFKYVLGFAASLHQLQAYSDAAVGFFLAYNLDPENPIPAYYAADCFIKTDEIEAADEFLAIAIKVAEKNPVHHALKERCELIRKSLKLKK